MANLKNLSPLDDPLFMANFRRLQAQGVVRRLARRAGEERLAIQAGRYVPQPSMRKLLLDIERTPKNRRPKCGAKCRDGHPCRATAVDGMMRCRVHGGLSTGPRTEEGRAAIVQSNMRRAANRNHNIVPSG